MADSTALTDKQEKVLRMLGEGKTVHQIAKAMKIGTAGVYGHMRKLRAAGVTLPGESVDDAHAGAAPANGNGAVEPDVAQQAVIEAIEAAQAVENAREVDVVTRIQQAEEIVKQATTEIERLTAEAEEANAALQRYSEARKALAS